MSDIRKKAKISAKKAGKIAAAAATGVLISGALAVSNVFPSGADITRPQEPSPIVQTGEYAARPSCNTLYYSEEKKSRRASDRLKQWITGLPQAVKVLVVTPVWCLGRVLTWLAGALISALSPVAGAIGSFIMNLALVAGAAALLFRLLFPDRPLKELFKKRNILIIAALALLLAAADAVLPIFIAQYAAYAHAVKVGLTLIIPAGLIILTALKKRPAAQG